LDIIDKLKYYQEKSPFLDRSPSVSTEEICTNLGGEFIEKNIPSAIKIEKYFPYDSFIANNQFRKDDFVILPILTKKQFSKEIILNDILIFDIETTGLMGGTGCYPFLLGFGTFQNDGIMIRQYFLPDYGKEIHAYLDLRKEMENRSILLSFNGKTFDYPLLRNRFILNRIDNPFENYEHLDLLHVARRLWKHVLESCRLENIENEIFLFSRWGDIEGALIPQAYFDFLATGFIETIKKIIQHNQQDILSLARLLLHLNLLENHPDKGTMNEHELQMLCSLAIKNSDIENTDFLLSLLKERDISLSTSLLIDLSLLFKRVGQWTRAEQIWLDLLRSGRNIIFASEELAKYYEHQKVNIEQAKIYAQRGLTYLDVINELETMESDLGLRQQFEYRLSRLERKLITSKK
jgi:uncharacterized protein YprB with RNaseH-like and TPR domain